MKNYYYYQAFRKTTVQFLDLFNDIKIRRYDRGGNFVKYVEVPVKYSDKGSRKSKINLPKDGLKMLKQLFLEYLLFKKNTKKIVLNNKTV